LWGVSYSNFLNKYKFQVFFNKKIGIREPPVPIIAQKNLSKPTGFYEQTGKEQVVLWSVN
jgi:hypothetical protein